MSLRCQIPARDERFATLDENLLLAEEGSWNGVSVPHVLDNGVYLPICRFVSEDGGLKKHKPSKICRGLVSMVDKPAPDCLYFGDRVALLIQENQKIPKTTQLNRSLSSSSFVYG
ncbi:hypothetical protein MN608_06784 [Microdochium nivale]|nr:hypothetical protein MN608_06784 [Microdochium nivale]